MADPPLLIDARAAAAEAKTPFSVNRDGVKFYGITPQQWVFIQEYVTTNDAYSSYARAFNCTTQVAKQSAKRLLNRPEIQKVVQDLLAELGRAMGNRRDAIQAMLWRMAMDPEAKNTDRLRALAQLGEMGGHVDPDADKKKQKIAPTVNVFIAGENQQAQVAVNDQGDAVAVNIRPSVLIEADRSQPTLNIITGDEDDESRPGLETDIEPL